MRQFLIAAVIAILASVSSAAPLTRSKAKSILESQPWRRQQRVMVFMGGLECGVKAGLWDFHAKVVSSNAPILAHWDPTTEGRKLGLVEVIDYDDLSDAQDDGMVHAISMWLHPGFRVSVTITGLADAGDANHKYVEANVKAKIAHPCFEYGLAFAEPEEGRVREVGKPVGVTFVLFDDGWRIAQ